jgi:signal transduction histidine kinase
MVLGTPNEVIDNSIASLTRLMLATGAGLLVVAPIGGYLLARNATQPIRKIISTTRSLDPTHLESRLEVRGTGDELDQLSLEINSFLDQISKYLNSHREFVENAAHELRSPLTAIQTSVEVALGKERTLAEYREELETVSEQCQQLRHLVNQLLELAETDAAIQKTSFETFDFTKLVEKSVDVFAGIAEDKEVAVDTQLQEGVVMQGDSSKIRQVFNNLLDNALKFTPRGGQIDIALSATPQQVRFSVQDTGPGVSEAELPRIFERFYQADVSRRRSLSRGSGLGLSICKSIVDMHRGEISASRSQTGGLNVVVLLPIVARRSPL